MINNDNSMYYALLWISSNNMAKKMDRSGQVLISYTKCIEHVFATDYFMYYGLSSMVYHTCQDPGIWLR